MPRPTNEAIAIVGMACRFPGANDIEAFWRLLDSGTNAVTEGVPGSGIGRAGQLFSDDRVKRACRFAGFLDRLDEFDASFFRISPVEAQRLDPQQRMMLETSWQALEDAGIDPERLQGSRTGVYAGISNYDYRALVLEAGEPTEPAASLYSVTGTSFNTAIGRVAFALGLNGPAMAVDTACSSSLVAIHQAVSGLQRGEADMALAGGVHVILSSQLFEMRANAGMLSPDGRCATFDAGANGYVRGEGCGILVLKRLTEAVSDGDRIWAVVRATALNQDGATPGLTVPSAEAQERCIEDALLRAGLQPSDVDYVEAHGTGTEVGDPIEARATAAAYGMGREPDRPLVIGSVKTNIGHLEAAAGVAGVIKTVLSMGRRTIPKHLHFHTPNPQIDWDRIPLRVAGERMEWPLRSGRLPRAGVSGFGWSGTNAHVLLEGHEVVDGTSRDGDPIGRRCPVGSALPVAVSLGEDGGPEVPLRAPGGKPAGRVTRILPLSGRSGEALRELAERYLDWVDERVGKSSAGNGAGDSLLADMAWTAGVGRSHFDHRAGVLFRDAASLREGLRKIAGADGRPAAGKAATVAFAFAGQASQWPGMGATLYASEPVVRAVLDRCDEVLRKERDASLLDVMFGRPGALGDLDDPQWKQPAIYALECALAALWSSLGVRPDVVLGHSLGEIAAARTAGVFGLEDGLRLAAVRGTLIGALPGEGAMAAVFAPVSRVAQALDAYNAALEGIGLCIAADNGAHQVISGPAAEVDAILERLEADRIQVARLRKSPAYHSAMIEPALDDLEEALSQLSYAPPQLPFISNLTGRAIEPGEALDAAYWRRQMRAPVAFRACVETLAGKGVDAVVEIGPHSVLGPMTTLAWPESAGTPAAPLALSSLKRPGRKVSAAEAEDAFFAAVAGAYEAGLPLRFHGLFAGESRRRISLPGYPFRRDRHWIDAPRRRRSSTDHPLLGSRHESASGEISFDTELFPSDPPWLGDHRVFDRVVAPGALYGALAASAYTVESPGPAIVEDFQMRSALVFPDSGDGDGSGEGGCRLQLLLDGAREDGSRRVRVLSRSAADEEWTLHAEGRVATGAGSDLPPDGPAPDLTRLRSSLAPVDLASYYNAKAEVGINLGPSFRTLEALWAGPGEAMGEVSLPDSAVRGGLAFHPLVLDGCFQVMGAARESFGSDEDVTYLPFGWERLSVPERLPERLLCHVRVRETPDGAGPEPPEVLSADITLCNPEGSPIGTLDGYTVKRATRSALLPAVEGVEELLYEVAWRDRALPPGMPAADFLPGPSAAASRSRPFSRYLAAEGVEVDDETGLQADMERVSWCYALSALEALGWERGAGAAANPEELSERLGVLPGHMHLLRRMLEILARSGVVLANGRGFVVAVGAGDPLPDEMPRNVEAFLSEVEGRFPHAVNEIGLFRRCAGALPEVLRGNEDPLALLFGDAEPNAVDLYRRAPAWRAANGMLGEVVRTLVDESPDGRRLRVLEVGAGIGSATEYVLPVLPPGRFDYTYTDISAGFFADAEARFSAVDASIDYRVLDIEKDPLDQGFEAHGYDLVIAANVLHATRHLDETLAHCRALLAPSGLLVALENQRGRGWMDLIFGQLDGWWRFADRYRPNHALAGPEVWRSALADTGFAESEVLGLDRREVAGLPDRGVIVAQGPAEVALPEGVWVLAGDRGGVAAALAAGLAAQNQRVVLAGGDPAAARPRAEGEAGIVAASVEMERRESWRALFEGLPSDAPLAGVAHLVAQDGHGPEAATAEMAADAKRAAASALALVQGIADADVVPEKGVWFVTTGAQVLERERTGQLAGAALWGFGKVVAREAPHLQPRMLDLDPEAAKPWADLADELLFPDSESHIAYREGLRQVARLVRTGTGVGRLALPEESNWVLAPGEGGAIETLTVQPVAPRALEPKEVRVAVEACGLNFLDVFRAMGLVEDEGLLGEEMCGRVVEVGSRVTGVAVGDRVAGFAFGTFGPEVVTREELVAPAPPGESATALATIPSVFVTCVLSYELAGLQAGDRVLIHAGAGGVGLAAIQLAQAEGAEVFATASAGKRDYLRSLGVEHVFDSRSTAFGREILEVTGGDGVDVVLNSLTGEGFIEASLDCLAQGGRFVELARRDILSEEEMAALRPDVAYAILDLYTLKEQDPAGPGGALREVLARMAKGELAPLRHTIWPMAETSVAMGYMRAARHIGKIVLTTPALGAGRLRRDGTYLVTGGLGGIGVELAAWLAERGAGTVVLNGRRAPDAAAEEAIEALRARGFRIRVEIADVTDTAALDAMLKRMDGTLPPLAGVIHSVGVLSDAALGNQSWEGFETVLWPKMLGAWHLHRATMDRDLDMFVLFSSVAGVLGNPGQANHAAANAFLDQLAVHRRALGLPGQAIAWGAWSGIGEAEEQRGRIAERREVSGTGWFSPEQGFMALDRLLREDRATPAVLAADWPVFGKALKGRHPLFDDLTTAEEDTGSDAEDSSEDLLASLRVAPAEAREELLSSFLQREIQAVLRLPSAPPPAVGFFDLGMDSLVAVELRNRLNRAFAGEYAAPNTVVFDYPDIASLARHLADELGGEEGSAAADTATRVPADAPSHPGEAPRPRAPEVEPEPEQPFEVVDGIRERQPTAPTVPSGRDGVAIIGMACRFPGAPDLRTFWSLLEAGRDAVTDDGRPGSGPWNGVSGDPAIEDSVARRGGFVDGIDVFDARFFGITPIGARLMDPQQRLLLETTWHALEDAGIEPRRLRGSRTGVYAGIATSEYRDGMASGEDGINYLGTAGSMAVGAVAYRLGLMGPSMPVVLNCAASLVAVHHAVAALRQGEADLALVGGVNAVLSRGLAREMMALGMLSPEGRCRTFDASANGFVRSEGCGMVVLKRLPEAKADGDRIWGVINGSAVNQNGATAGPTVPNSRAQQRVIEEALARAGVPPAGVDYLEAHGGASELGDPIELQAAATAYGRGRETDRPLLVGSVKTNIGHLESAAGVAALIKAVLAMKQGVIPRHLHFREPNPHVDWDGLPLRVTSATTPWPQHPERPPRAGVSAFGISGTNAHVVVEGYEGDDDIAHTANGMLLPAGLAQTAAVRVPDLLPNLQPGAGDFRPRTACVLPLSGKSDEALRELAERYLVWLDEHDGDLTASGEAADSLLRDMAWTAATGRDHFPHRAGVAFRDADSLRAGLHAIADPAGRTSPRTVREPGAAPRVAFAYSGDGGVSAAMGRELYETEPVVRAVLDRCDEVWGQEHEPSLLEVMFGRAATEADPHDPALGQPAIFALECALTTLWASVGVRPRVVFGNGIGEVAAAWTARVFGLEDGLRIAVARGGAQSAIERVPNTDPLPDRKPRQRGDPLDDLEAALSEVEVSPPAVAFLSQVTGQVLATDQVLDGAYWREQACAPASRRRRAGAPADLDVDLVLEIGAGRGRGPVPLQAWPEPAEHEGDTFAEWVAQAYAAGLPVSFAGLFAGEERRRISVPGYPFQRKRYWFEVG